MYTTLDSTLHKRRDIYLMKCIHSHITCVEYVAHTSKLLDVVGLEDDLVVMYFDLNSIIDKGDVAGAYIECADCHKRWDIPDHVTIDRSY